MAVRLIAPLVKMELKVCVRGISLIRDDMMSNIDWNNVIWLLVLTGLVGYVFKGVDLAMTAVGIMLLFLIVVIFSDYINTKKK